MTVHIDMQNAGVVAGVMTVEFHEPDGTLNDVVTYPIAPGQTIAMTEAARNTQSGPSQVADAEIVVFGSVGASLIGWMSAETSGKPQYTPNPPFTPSFCITT